MELMGVAEKYEAQCGVDLEVLIGFRFVPIP